MKMLANILIGLWVPEPELEPPTAIFKGCLLQENQSFVPIIKSRTVFFNNNSVIFSKFYMWGNSLTCYVSIFVNIKLAPPITTGSVLPKKWGGGMIPTPTPSTVASLEPTLRSWTVLHVFNNRLIGHVVNPRNTDPINNAKIKPIY